MSGGENNVSLDLPELQLYISDVKITKNNVKIAKRYISKALHNYAKFHDKPVETVEIMDLITSSAGVKGWRKAFDHERCSIKY